MPKAIKWILLLVWGLIVLLEGYGKPASAMESNGSWTIYPSMIQLRVGEQQQISVITKKPLPYTTVFGWDNPSIGNLSAQGLFTARFPGQGLITVSAGNQRQHIYVKVVE